MLVGLATACAGKAQNGPGASAGSSGAGERAGSGGADTAGAGSDAGAAGADDGGAGEGGSLTNRGGNGGASGGVGKAGSGGTGGGTVSGGNGGSAGMVLYPPIDIGAQKKSDKLDVLFVVDNSVTMADKQHILSNSVASFVTRLVNPLCLDAEGKPVETQPATADAACTTGTREFTPVKDLHLGVITTSIGGHGGEVCKTATSTDDHLDDRAELLPTQRSNLPSYDNSGYLAYDSTGSTGSTDVAHVILDLQTVIDAAGEHGCGYEAPLEAMYRFLVEPEPPTSVVVTGGISTPSGINQTLLTQRKAFLRPDSAVAIVILSDESDCSIRDDTVGWFVGANSRMPLSTTACETNANDPCCRSCASSEITPRPGCAALSEDANCKNIPTGGSYATWDALHDSLNLRCFDQQRRFGFDLLYPVERYRDALSNPQVRNRSKALVPNPLLVGDENGPRSATLISVSLIVGAPWQDLATPASLTSGHAIEYMDGAALESNGRWPLLIGDRAQNLRPTDPFMIESIEERTGLNPLTNAPIVASTSTNPLANPINGHEQNLPQRDDLQFACTFPLPTPRACAPADVLCACSPDKMGKSDAVKENRSPLCQPPEGGAATTTQYFGRGYPGTRELTFAKQLGARAVPASICPRTLTDSASPDYAYRPAFNALITRIGATLK